MYEYFLNITIYTISCIFYCMFLYGILNFKYPLRYNWKHLKSNFSRQILTMYFKSSRASLFDVF